MNQGPPVGDFKRCRTHRPSEGSPLSGAPKPHKMSLPRNHRCGYSFFVLTRLGVIGCTVWGPLAQPLAAQLVGASPEVVFIRVDSRGGASSSVAYLNGVAGLLEWKASFETGYREVDGAVGYRWSGPHGSLIAGAMFARDAEPLAGLALWPAVSVFPVVVSGQVVVLLPLRSGSHARYYADPFRAFLRLNPCCQAGLYYRRDQFGIAPADWSIGPSFQAVRRKWRLTVDLPLVPTQGRELRTTILTSW